LKTALTRAVFNHLKPNHLPTYMRAKHGTVVIMMRMWWMSCVVAVIQCCMLGESVNLAVPEPFSASHRKMVLSDDDELTPCMFERYVRRDPLHLLEVF